MKHVTNCINKIRSCAKTGGAKRLVKNRRMLIASLVLLLCIGGLGSTAAYYSTQAIATNVITSGNIRAEIREWADEEMTIPFQNYTLAMPGTEATKVVTVLNTGDYDAWVRLRVAKGYELAAPQTRDALAQAQAEEELIHLLINSNDWTEKDGWYYYNNILKPGELSAPLFTAIILDWALGNVWQGATVTIDVDMDAVQVANNGSTVLEAAGWPTV